VEYPGALPENLFVGSRSCLNAPAWVVTQDGLDEGIIRRGSGTRVERELAIRYPVSVISAEMVVVLPVTHRAGRLIFSGFNWTLGIGRAHAAHIRAAIALSGDASSLPSMITAAPG